MGTWGLKGRVERKWKKRKKLKKNHQEFSSIDERYQSTDPTSSRKQDPLGKLYSKEILKFASAKRHLREETARMNNRQSMKRVQIEK